MKAVVVLCAVFVAVYAHPKNVFEFGQPKEGGKHWALLVAGSNTWMNYRHQADICHAYQILKSHGIPDENIVVMMYDDIAENRENPTKGKIINQPNGPDVYTGVPKDYTGLEVTPSNFIAALTGDAAGANGKKVINSGPNDHIFVNFVDHGAPGFVAFGHKQLKASTLNTAIKKMYQDKKFAKMVVYVEACESGSMFEGLLPDDIDVFATTASNAHESSYACYFDKERRTYLGDVYSVKWMQDSDKENLNTETLQKQFSITKMETNTSHVMEYGDMSMNQMTVAEFQGTQMAQTAPYSVPDACADGVKSEDVPMQIYWNLKEMATTEEEKALYEAKYQEVMAEREMVDLTIKNIIGTVFQHHSDVERMMTLRHKIKRRTCYESIIDFLQDNCKQLNIPANDYALRQLKAFVNMCEEGVSVEIMESAILKVCH